ncbi:MAG: hypothetical protein KDN05_01650 [Verrucomicrobiae bacterium]|nr:hypothetical protein [Verrucomicrobiae bacterium]MCP5544878.1 hypothetical protein [Akkermansiaceae bacterium]MCP5547159.1 hypothetical protein [Akkermansiaceae bacterium]
MNLRDDETTIQNLLDGKLGEAEFIRIEQRLAEDAGFRSLYLSYAKSHHLLIERFEASGIQACVASPGPIVLCRRRMAMALAAVLTALATAGALFQVLKKEPSAQLVFGPETGARLDHPEGKAGGDRMWPGSSLELDRGSISLVMPSGVRGYIEGPGRLEMESPTKLVLRSGRAWFDVPEGAEGFVCATESLFVEDLGTQFGVIADPGRPEQVHVLKGKVRLHPLNHPSDTRQLVTGEGTEWIHNELANAEGPVAFSNAFPSKVVVFSDSFSDPDGTPLHGKAPEAGAGPWTLTRGEMTVRDGHIDTRGQRRNAAFAPLLEPRLDDLTHIMLMTIEAKGPGDEGWAGVSLYTGDVERIFVGDPNGPVGDWALHPAGAETIYACPLLSGKSTVTLRYNYRNGHVELFEGSTTTGTPLVSQWIAPGLAFDRIRIANGSQLDAILDAGGNEAEVKMYDTINVRSNISVRNIRVSVLSAAVASAGSR